jgi:hypothetical protein
VDILSKAALVFLAFSTETRQQLNCGSGRTLNNQKTKKKKKKKKNKEGRKQTEPNL